MKRRTARWGPASCPSSHQNKCSRGEGAQLPSKLPRRAWLGPQTYSERTNGGPRFYRGPGITCTSVTVTAGARYRPSSVGRPMVDFDWSPPACHVVPRIRRSIFLLMTIHVWTDALPAARRGGKNEHQGLAGFGGSGQKPRAGPVSCAPACRVILAQPPDAMRRKRQQEHDSKGQKCDTPTGNGAAIERFVRSHSLGMAVAGRSSTDNGLKCNLSV